jgi:hypothetical protein
VEHSHPAIVSRQDREASNRQNRLNQLRRFKVNLLWQERRLPNNRVAYVLSNTLSFLKEGCTMQ